MKVGYYAKYSDQGPSSRFRVFQFVPYFRKAGVQLDIHVLFDDRYFDFLRMHSWDFRGFRKSFYVAGRFGRRIESLKRNEADLFVIEHQLFPYLPFGIERKFLPERYLLEFDDAIYLTHPKKIPEMVRHATGVIVGNPFLADYARKYHERVYVIPTVLDTDRFQPALRLQKDKIVVGWSGLEYNFKYLKTIATVLARLLERYPVEILILSGSPPKDFSFPYRFEKWSSERETEQISRFDIGLMPLEWDEWCRGKCGMKLLQYMSLQIPSVSTPVGVNSEIIRDRENGLLAGTPQEWEERLSELIESAELRKSMGEAARKTVVESYSVQRWFPQILEIYERHARS